MRPPFPPQGGAITVALRERLERDLLIQEAEGEPLLFKGEDFARADIEAA